MDRRTLIKTGAVSTAGEAMSQCVRPFTRFGTHHMRSHNSFVLDTLAHARHQALLDEAARDRLVASGSLRVEIDRTFPLSEAADAHAFIESRQAFGRVVMTP